MGIAVGKLLVRLRQSFQDFMAAVRHHHDAFTKVIKAKRFGDARIVQGKNKNALAKPAGQYCIIGCAVAPIGRVKGQCVQPEPQDEQYPAEAKGHDKGAQQLKN